MLLDMDAVLENSYKNFHSKGLDYICLKRSDEYTQKLYFFDGDVSKLPEVVNPHDHRYDFNTMCLAGEVENIIYESALHPVQIAGRSVQTYQAFKYFTPLNGGNGFTWWHECQLFESGRRSYLPGEDYFMSHTDRHTIRMLKDETVIMLEQFEDREPINFPTKTFVLGTDKEPPSLDGLYDRFTADEVIAKLRRLQERVPAFQIPEF
jgi:hypothetical protein